MFQTIGDISIALGSQFDVYSSPVLNVALQAFSIPFIQNDDYDLIDDLNDVREACLQVFIMVIRGTFIEIKKNNGDINSFTTTIPKVINGIQQTLSDPNCNNKFTDLVCGFYGDLATLYGTELLNVIDINSTVLFLQGQIKNDKEQLPSANWAYNCFLENKLVNSK